MYFFLYLLTNFLTVEALKSDAQDSTDENASVLSTRRESISVALNYIYFETKVVSIPLILIVSTFANVVLIIIILVLLQLTASDRCIHNSHNLT